MTARRTFRRQLREPRRFRRRRQAAFSLTEIMLSVSLCMPLVLGTTNLLCQSVAEQALSHHRLLMEQNTQFALNAIARIVELAGHNDPLSTATRLAEPRLQGWDDATLAARTDIVTGKSGPGPSGSDVLIVNFMSSATATTSALNCAGMPVPLSAASALGKTAKDQGYSIFYVARGPDGEDELRCKYRTAIGWDSEALVQGVESFQVLYGLDRDGDGQPDQFLRAGAISDEISRGASDASLWHHVVALKVALLMCGTQRLLQTPPPARWDLFGDEYSALHANDDRGTMLTSDNLSTQRRHRLRRSYEQLIFLRNPARGAALG